MSTDSFNLPEGRPNRLRRALLTAPLALLLAAPAALAQDRSGTVELTPFGGAYIGGTLYAGSNVIFSRDVDVDSAGMYGARLGVNLNRWLGLEASWAHANADIRSEGGGLFGDSGRKLGELKTDSFDLNAVFSFGHRRVIPYFTLGAGATVFNAKVPDFPTDDDTRFAANMGLGVKVFFNPHVAVRFEGRGRAAYVNDSRRCRHSSSYCDGTFRDDDDRRWYGNGEITGALTFAF